MKNIIHSLDDVPDNLLLKLHLHTSRWNGQRVWNCNVYTLHCLVFSFTRRETLLFNRRTIDEVIRCLLLLLKVVNIVRLLVRRLVITAEVHVLRVDYARLMRLLLSYLILQLLGGVFLPVSYGLGVDHASIIIQLLRILATGRHLVLLLVHALGYLVGLVVLHVVHALHDKPTLALVVLPRLTFRMS